MSDKFDFFLTALHSANQQAESNCARLKDMSAPILDVFEKLKDPACFSFGRYHFAYKHEIDGKKAACQLPAPNLLGGRGLWNLQAWLISPSETTTFDRNE